LGAHLIAPALLIAIASDPARAADDFSQYAETPNQKSVAAALARGEATPRSTRFASNSPTFHRRESAAASSSSAAKSRSSFPP
jgi:hypothetical protein